jgi:hypothetical protein
MAYIYDLTDTWNAGGTTFNAIKMNVTDSASAAASKLVTLQTNGTEHFSVTKGGQGYFSGNVGIGTNNPVTWRMYLSQTGTDLLNLYNSTGTGVQFSMSDQGWSGGVNMTNGNLIFQSGGITERMRLDASGNLGLGRVPTYKFDVVGSSNSQIGIRTPDGAAGSNASPIYQSVRFFGYAGTERARITGIDTAANNVNGQLGFWTGQAGSMAENMRIDAVGNVGIGTTSPTEKLQVESSALFQAIFKGTDAGGGGGIRTYNSGGTAGVALLTYGPSYAGGSIGSVGTNGSAVVQTGDAPMFVGTDAGISQPVYFGTNGLERMRLNNAGNVGINCAPSPWASSWRAIDITTGGGALFGSLAISGIANNAYLDSGANWRYKSDFGASQIYMASNGTIGFYNAPAGTAGNVISFTEKMTITSAGNVGINTISPAYKLHVAGDGYFTDQLICGTTIVTGAGVTTQDTAIEVGGQRLGNGNCYIDMHAAAGTDYETRIFRAPGTNGDFSLINTGTGLYKLITENAAPIAFFTSNTERARIDSSGNLLWGKTSLSNEVTTDGAILYKNASGGGSTAYFTNGGNGTAMAVSTQADATAIQFFRSGSSVGSIGLTTTSTTYYTSSDARLKENVADADGASSLIDAIQVRKFDWKANGEHQRYGFIAQELLEVAPEAVSQPADPEEMMGVDYSKLVPMLVKELQSLRARVAQLEGN